MSISGRERMLALAAGVVGVGVALYLVVDGWVIPTWTGLKEEVARKEEELAGLKAVAETADERRAEYERRARLALAYETPADAAQFFWNKLNVLARGAGMDTPNMSPLPPKREEHFHVIRFNFNVRCSLGQLLAFMDRFYALEGAHRIDNVNITPPSRYVSEGDPLTVQMGISAVVIPREAKKRA